MEKSITIHDYGKGKIIDRRNGCVLVIFENDFKVWFEDKVEDPNWRNDAPVPTFNQIKQFTKRP